MHDEYLTNIAGNSDSGLEIDHSFDLDRTIFKPKAGSSSISFDFAAFERNLKLKLYAFNISTLTSKLYYLSYYVHISGITDLSFKKAVQIH